MNYPLGVPHEEGGQQEGNGARKDARVMTDEVLIIDNVTVVPGDGSPPQPERRITVYGSLIEEIGPRGRSLRGARVSRVIDGTGMIALPGIVNMHGHVLTFGPRLRGEPPYPVNHVAHHLWRHFVYGTTTILSVDGYLLPYEAKVGMRHVPIKIQSTTLHTPKNIESAKRCHLEYTLSEEQETCTVEKALDLGATCIGQVGGVFAILNMCYEQIPDAVYEATGRRIGPVEGRRLMECVLGMTVDESVYEPSRVLSELNDMGLGDLMTPSQARDIVHAIVLPVHKVQIEATYESAAVAKRLGVPVLLSNNTVMKEALREISKELGSLLIAVHSNHPSFSQDEAIEQAKFLKSNGAVIEVSTGDHLGLARMFTSGEVTRAMFRMGLVDLLSTDHTGGYFEPILRVIEWLVAEGTSSLGEAITYGTQNPARAIPRLAPNCGVLAPSRTADIALVNKDRLSEVIAVISDGRLVLGPLTLDR